MRVQLGIFNGLPISRVTMGACGEKKRALYFSDSNQALKKCFNAQEKKQEDFNFRPMAFKSN